MEKVNGIENKRYLRVGGVANYTKLSEKTIRAYVAQRKIPYIKVNKCILFAVPEIDNWIDSFHHYPVVKEGTN